MIGFHEVRFPEDVSWGSQGGPVFKTQVFTSHRGHEKRNIDWSQPMMEFNVAYGIKQDSHILSVMNFFNARQGRLFGFRYKNWADYRASGEVARGDGDNRRLPLYKKYSTPSGEFMCRRLWKIVRGSVRGVVVGGTPSVEGAGFHIDYDSGEIILNSNLADGDVVTVENLEFDEPVRFDEDSLDNVIDAYNNNSLSKLSLVGIRDTFTSGTGFSPNLREQGGKDPLFQCTYALLNFDTPDTATVFRDHSFLLHEVSATGASITTSAYRHGAGALELADGGMLEMWGGVDMFDTNAFTIEVFATCPQDGATLQPIVGRWQDLGMQRSWLLRYNTASGNLEFAASSNGNTSRVILSHPWHGDVNHFDYLSVDRTMGGLFILRINGEVKQVARDTGGFHSSLEPVTVGGVPTPAAGEGSFYGLIDSMRITRMIARHPKTETIPIPSIFPVS